MSLQQSVPSRSSSSGAKDLSPDINFASHDDGCDYRASARYVRDLVLAGDPATLTEDLALAAVDAIDMRDSYRAGLSSAVARERAALRIIARQRETITYLMDAAHTAHADQRAA
ncbi:MAG TPA: hypothetical protein VG538_11470 [Vicinamibacterales bacterium]|jgi:hypothetical protein|nr:hypothetical protein [Vicinamibacterales bacterium]